MPVVRLADQRPLPTMVLVVLLFSHFTGKQTNIQDPYYGGNDGFHACYNQCVRYSSAILE